MKATINGVTVEGTPKEIAEFVNIVGEAKVPAPTWPAPSRRVGDVTWKSGNITLWGAVNAAAAPCPAFTYKTV